MKKVFILCAFLLLGLIAKAQNIVLQNTSCQPVLYSIGCDVACGVSNSSTAYYIAPGGGLKLSMYPGGPYPMVNWTAGVPAPGSQFTIVKIYDPASTWGNFVSAPCFGPPAFGPQPGCGAQANSTGWFSSFVFINVF